MDALGFRLISGILTVILVLGLLVGALAVNGGMDNVRRNARILISFALLMPAILLAAWLLEQAIGSHSWLVVSVVLLAASLVWRIYRWRSRPPEVVARRREAMARPATWLLLGGLVAGVVVLNVLAVLWASPR